MWSKSDAPGAAWSLAVWRCLATDDDWRAVSATGNPGTGRLRIGESMFDPKLQAHLRDDPPVARRLPGTPGGGHLLVCEVRPERMPE